jgi:hypothetical protein
MDANKMYMVYALNQATDDLHNSNILYDKKHIDNWIFPW